MQNLLELESSLFTDRAIAVIAGILLTALGCLVFVRNSLAQGQDFRWWALFILLPALLLYGCAWATAHWQVPYRVSVTLFGLGLIVMTVAAIFLLNLGWDRWWPLMVLTPGLTIFLLGLPDSTLVRIPAASAWVGLLAWIGAMMMALGLTFLAGNFHLIDLSALTDRFGWWGAFILLCALGAVFNGVWLWMQTGQISLAVAGLGAVAFTLLIAALFELFNLDRMRELPVVLIGAGILFLLYTLIARLSGSSS